MKIAIVFPGQGSQAVGMLGELAANYSQIINTFAEGSEVLGYDLWQVVTDGPSAQLNQTEITQPAMLCAGIAAYRIFANDIKQDIAVMAGHSLGEYTALVVAGALKFKDAVAIVKTRGELMQQAVPEGKGAMAAILGLADEVIIKICAKTKGVVEAVNFNSPGQVVIAGERFAVKAACDNAKQQNARRALILPVSVPSHSSLMQDAAKQFAKVLAKLEINPPQIPVINNVAVQKENDPESIRMALVKQLYNPVRWVETVLNMQKSGVNHIVEAGPGKVLTGLNRRIAKEINGLSIHDEKTYTQLLKDLA